MPYYIRKDDVILGPYSEQELTANIKMRALSSLDEISVDKLHWTRIGTTDFYRRCSSPSIGTFPQSTDATQEIGVKYPQGKQSNTTNTQPTKPFVPPKKHCKWPWIVFIILIILAGAVAAYLTFTSPSQKVTDDTTSPHQEVTEDSKIVVHDPKTATLAYILPSEDEINQIFEMVKTSPYILSNKQYSDTAQTIKFFFDRDNKEINAYATGNREIHLLGGYVNISRLVGALYAKGEQEGCENANNVLFKLLPDFVATKGLEMTEEDILTLLGEGELAFDDFFNGAFASEAKAIADGMLIASLGHELGHISLGHVFGGCLSYDISRNQEREADSFAASVINLHPYARYGFLGRFLSQYIFFITRKNHTDDTYDTHPLDAERLVNLVRSNRQVAEKFGITEEFITEFVKQMQTQEQEPAQQEEAQEPEQQTQE